MLSIPFIPKPITNNQPSIPSNQPQTNQPSTPSNQSQTNYPPTPTSQVSKQNSTTQVSQNILPQKSNSGMICDLISYLFEKLFV